MEFTTHYISEVEKMPDVVRPKDKDGINLYAIFDMLNDMAAVTNLHSVAIRKIAKKLGIDEDEINVPNTF